MSFHRDGETGPNSETGLRWQPDWRGGWRWRLNALLIRWQLRTGRRRRRLPADTSAYTIRTGTDVE